MNKEDRYIELARLQLLKFQKSQDIEWKVNLSLWTLIVAAGHFLTTKLCVPLSGCGQYVIVSLGILFITVLHGMWLYRVQHSQERDKRYFQDFRNGAQGVAVSVPVEHNDIEVNGRAWTWIILSALMTLVLLSLVCLLVKFSVPV